MAEERGRRRNRIRSLSPPGRTRSSSLEKIRSSSRSRTRDISPFSINSKFSTNHIINNPFNNPSFRDINDYRPILEDTDEDQAIEMRPILPVFNSDSSQNVMKDSIVSDINGNKNIINESSLKKSTNGLKSTKMKMSDSELSQIPLPMSEQLEADFEKQFKKDLKIKDIKKNNMYKNSTPENPTIDYTSDEDDLSTDTSTGNERSAGNNYDDDDDDDDHEINNIDSKLASSYTRYEPNNLLYGNKDSDGVLFDNNSIRNSESRSKSHTSTLLEDAFKKIDNEQNEPQTSTVLKWLHFPNKFSFGKAITNNVKMNKKNEKYQMNDLESVQSNVSSLTKDLIHGKPIIDSTKNYDQYDDVLDDNVHIKRKLFDSGITSNLMKLYNQIPDSSEDELFGNLSVDPNEYLSENESTFEGSLSSSRNKITEKVKNLKNNKIFHSRESSRERPMLKEEVKSNEYNNFNLPSFTMPKKNKRLKKIKKKSKKDKAARITVHIVDLIHRQEFLLKLCKAFMIFGAPNHRLEEYMTLTAKVLEIDATFIYLPGMMLANFSDPVTRTSDLKLVRVGQGLDLNKLDLAHDLYEAVVFDRIGVDEASIELDNLLETKNYWNIYWVILYYGLSSMFVLIFFNGAWLDMIPSFILGALLGFFQCVIAPKNEIYSSIFEVGSAIFISFIARAIGSIDNGKYFCFSAVVLSGLCMILPGYMILRGALEIQSKSIVSGVVGMFYAIIYSLFLGFGLMLGSGLYGWIDKNAIKETTCKNIGNIGKIWQLLFVPLFNIFMVFACQARYHQLSIMLVISCSGYVVTYFSSLHFGITQLNSALGSFTVGLLSNIYDRWLRNYRKIGYCSTKFTSMICGIFDLVPGGFAARNVLSSGLFELENNGNKTSSATSVENSTLSFGISMIEIAIGITVGLFMSTVVVYPLGKKRQHAASSIGL